MRNAIDVAMYIAAAYLMVTCVYMVMDIKNGKIKLGETEYLCKEAK